MSTIIAELRGTYTNPQIVLPANLSFGASGWVKNLPGRTWNPGRKQWTITGTGANPEKLFARRNVHVEIHPQGQHPSLANVDTLNDLVEPIAKMSSTQPGFALVRHRLAGYDTARNILGLAARWDKKRNLFTCHLSDLLDGDEEPKKGLRLTENTHDAALDTLTPMPLSWAAQVAASVLARCNGLNMTPRQVEALEALENKYGPLPDWFTYTLLDFQHIGVYAAVAGHRLIADEPGLGKTIQALGVAALMGAQRVVVVSPPVGTKMWVDTITTSGLVDAQRVPDASVVAFRAGTAKTPVLPERGAVVVPDSLLSCRDGLIELLSDWDPDLLIVDEVHRAKNFDTARTQAIWQLAERLRPATPRIGLTGTPLLSSMLEAGPVMAITGHLAPLFGGPAAFLGSYAYQMNHGGLAPRKKREPELARILDREVWVRRNKADTLIDLPPKTRKARMVDVDLGLYRQAHQEVADKVSEWMDSYTEVQGSPPDALAVADWAKGQIGLISPLRKAAGIAKVPEATRLVGRWLTKHPATKEGIYDNPLIVWVHHAEVLDALTDSLRRHQPDVEVGVIRGATTHHVRASVGADYQAGRIGVLVASIHAAGVALTLTRGCTALFVESDWTPAHQSQPESRQHRLGQTRPVTVHTLIAAGTLDERIQKVQQRKASTLENLMPGADNKVSALAEDTDDQLKSAADILSDIALAIAHRHTSKAA